MRRRQASRRLLRIMKPYVAPRRAATRPGREAAVRTGAGPGCRPGRPAPVGRGSDRARGAAPRPRRRERGPPGRPTEHPAGNPASNPAGHPSRNRSRGAGGAGRNVRAWHGQARSWGISCSCWFFHYLTGWLRGPKDTRTFPEHQEESCRNQGEKRGFSRNRPAGKLRSDDQRRSPRSGAVSSSRTASRGGLLPSQPDGKNRPYNQRLEPSKNPINSSRSASRAGAWSAGTWRRIVRTALPHQQAGHATPAGTPTAYWIVNIIVLEMLAMPDGAEAVSVTKAV